MPTRIVDWRVTVTRTHATGNKIPFARSPAYEGFLVICIAAVELAGEHALLIPMKAYECPPIDRLVNVHRCEDWWRCNLRYSFDILRSTFLLRHLPRIHLRLPKGWRPAGSTLPTTFMRHAAASLPCSSRPQLMELHGTGTCCHVDDVGVSVNNAEPREVTRLNDPRIWSVLCKVHYLQSQIISDIDFCHRNRLCKDRQFLL